MSTPRYDWWPYVKGMIRRYPELCARDSELHETAVTPRYGGTGGGRGGRRGGRSDPVANAALRELPEINRREIDAVARAISDTLRMPDGTRRLALMELVFWDRSHTLYGASLVLHVSKRTAIRWHGTFIKMVARNFGLLPETDKLAPQSQKNVIQ